MHKYLTYLGCILSGISSILVLVPFLCIWKVAYEILKVLPNAAAARNLEQYGWIAVGFSVVGIVVYFAALMCTHIAAFRTARNMRSEALHHILRLPLGYFDANGTGKLRRIIDESSGQTETFLAHMLPDLTGALVTPVAMLVLLMVFDFRMGLISLIPIVIGAFFLNAMMGANMVESMREYQNALEDMNNEAVEYIRGIPVVKTFGQTVFSFKNFHEAILRYKKWAVNYTISLRIPMCNFTVAINSVFALLIPAGILLIASAANPQKFLSDFIFYCIFTPIITVVMNKIMFTSENLMLARDAAARINSILEEQILEQPVGNAGRFCTGSDIEFHDVTFSYPGTERIAVEHVSLRIKEGSTAALVGPSGGGKTTAASLIPRFFDIDQGSITIGGIDVRTIPTEELMNKISFVFQNTKLFKMSLFENIRFSRPEATREQVMKAAKAAQCEEIFEKMPDGIDTVVGSKGTYLSGGEAQRIALARAILKDAPIVLLDEATAFADPENEYKIQQAFEVLTKDKTVLMIAHRLSTIQHADQILVMENGKIQEKGTHAELLEKAGLYHRMWNEYQMSVAWKVKEGKGKVK
ncbi:ABC transporter ATP-binding protein [Aminipila luticellarii]|uniref:ABC transporter ATP-binding protein n=2 Tax=Aminipila luticellarii TaxID=2507160 RepID=A0A410PYR4_9FIRM|nr:ABC transporter ATP-binding protein [Aminipila luticellarii]QAT44107.1 ABC transporter ATP-binding protein [Aminipila luticellarii]